VDEIRRDHLGIHPLVIINLDHVSEAQFAGIDFAEQGNGYRYLVGTGHREGLITMEEDLCTTGHILRGHAYNTDQPRSNGFKGSGHSTGCRIIRSRLRLAKDVCSSQHRAEGYAKKSGDNVSVHWEFPLVEDYEIEPVTWRRILSKMV
jgi:hypothetical protein